MNLLLNKISFAKSFGKKFRKTLPLDYKKGHKHSHKNTHAIPLEVKDKLLKVFKHFIKEQKGRGLGKNKIT
jgi:hypothetical protein